MEAKAVLRRAMKERLQRLSADEKQAESAIIVAKLRTLLAEAKGTIAVFFPYSDEPDITPLITELLERKFVVSLPKVDDTNMKMYRISSLVPEPTSNEPIDERTIDSVLVPGRAFTKEGHRLGRGNGAFDRWIGEQRKRNVRTQYIGICFNCQIVDHVPEEDHDEAMDIVVTASRPYRDDKHS